MSTTNSFDVPIKIENREELQKITKEYNEYAEKEKKVLLELKKAEEKYLEMKDKLEKMKETDIYIDSANNREKINYSEDEVQVKEYYCLQKSKYDEIVNLVKRYSYALGGNKYYDKKRLCDNIRFFMKEKNIKIGEIERSSGNTVGYMSRLEKDDNIKAPNFDFVITASKMLNVPLDQLVYYEPHQYTDTEKYINDFVEKLAKDTISDKIEWTEVKTYDFYDVNEEGKPLHEMMSFDTIMGIDPVSGYPRKDGIKVYFDSESFGEETKLVSSSYRTRLKNGVFIYVMNIIKNDDAFTDAIEIWLCHNGEKEYMCRNNEQNYTSDLVEVLEKSVRDYFERPRLSKTVKESIDAFMEDDVEDDFIY